MIFNNLIINSTIPRNIDLMRATASVVLKENLDDPNLQVMQLFEDNIPEKQGYIFNLIKIRKQYLHRANFINVIGTLSVGLPKRVQLFNNLSQKINNVYLRKSLDTCLHSFVHVPIFTAETELKYVSPTISYSIARLMYLKLHEYFLIKNIKVCKSIGSDRQISFENLHFIEHFANVSPKICKNIKSDGYIKIYHNFSGITPDICKIYVPKASFNISLKYLHGSPDLIVPTKIEARSRHYIYPRGTLRFKNPLDLIIKLPININITTNSYKLIDPVDIEAAVITDSILNFAGKPKQGSNTTTRIQPSPSAGFTAGVTVYRRSNLSDYDPLLLSDLDDNTFEQLQFVEIV